MPTLTKEQMEFLKSMDTPTACNVIEMVAPERRGHEYYDWGGFTDPTCQPEEMAP